MLKKVAIAFIATSAIFAIVAVGALVVTGNANNAACEEANDVRTVLTNVLTRARVVAASNPDFSPAEKVASKYFYNEALAELKKPHC